MIAILCYTFATYEPLKYHDNFYPDSAYGMLTKIIWTFSILILNEFFLIAAGWTIAAFGILQLPLWCLYAIVKQKGDTWLEKIQGAFRPKANWGPR